MSGKVEGLVAEWRTRGAKGGSSWVCADELESALSAGAQSVAAGGEVVLEGWDIRWQKDGDDSLILVGHPEHGAVGVWKDDESPRITTGPVLYALAAAILATQHGDNT